MNRIIHTAVRRDFGRLASALSAVPDGDRRRAQDLDRAFGNLHDQLTHHHQGEDRWVWPMLADVGVDRDLLATMESEHQAMSDALAAAAAAMNTFAASGSAAAAKDAQESVARAQGVVERHLSHEEEELEPLIIPHLGSAQWKAVAKKFSRQPPHVAGPFFAWLTDGMSPDIESSLRSAVPSPAIFLLSRVFGRRYNRDIAPVWRASPSR